MNVYDRIKEQSSKRGLTLQQLAEQAGLGINSIYRWRKLNPKMDSLQAVADVLNVSVDYLLGNTDTPQRLSDSKKEAPDLSKDVPFAFEGREIPAEQMELIRQMLANFKDDGNK